MLTEDKLETYEIVIEPEEVQAQPEGWKKISEDRTSQLDWVAPRSSSESSSDRVT
ncbi:MAG: hypothetical protein ABSD58_08335 [Verrucomicrobiia bacterium]|jgi:hypothetical protein